MTRGTTPTLNFTLPFNCSDMTDCNIAFSQIGGIRLEKELSDCTQNEKVLSLTLTEEETLIFDSTYPLEIQIRCDCGGTKMASNIIKTYVGRILKEGCLW